MTRLTIFLLGLLAASSAAYVVINPTPVEDKARFGLSVVEAVEEQAQLLEDAARRLRIAVKTPDGTVLSDDDESEYTIGDIVRAIGDTVNTVGDTVKKVGDAVGGVEETVEKAAGQQAGVGQ